MHYCCILENHVNIIFHTKTETVYLEDSTTYCNKSYGLGNPPVLINTDISFENTCSHFTRSPQSNDERWLVLCK